MRCARTGAAVVDTCAPPTSLGNVYTVQRREHEIMERREAVRSLGKRVDAALREAGAAGEGARHKWAGCFAALLRAARRMRAGVRGGAASVGADATSGSAAASVAKVFKGESAETKLAAAAESMRSRIATLEARAASERAESVRLAQLGQKAAALRTLRKAKASDATVARMHDALVAVDQQADLLAQAQMQKQLSSALASSNKAMRGGTKMLAGAEKAIDAAHDARDVVNDLGSVMAEFGQAALGDAADDDDLAQELEELVGASLVAEVAPMPSAAHAEATPSGPGAHERVPFPSAPQNQIASRKEEKVRLLPLAVSQ